MAIAFVNSWSGQNKTSGTTIAPGVTLPFTAGRTYFLFVTFDNLSSLTPNVNAVFTAGGTAVWMPVTSFNSTVGTTGGGVRGELWRLDSDATGSLPSSSSFISLSAAVTAKAWVMLEFTGVGAQTFAGGASNVTSASVNPGAVPAGDVVIRGAGAEQASGAIGTGPGMTANPGMGTTGGSAITNVWATLGYNILASAQAATTWGASGTDVGVTLATFAPAATGPVTHQVSGTVAVTTAVSGAATKYDPIAALKATHRGWWDFSDASSLTLSGGNVIDQVRDKSTQQNDLNRTGSPTLGSINGLGAVDFNLTSSLDRAGVSNIGQPNTIWAVVQADTLTGGPRNFVGHTQGMMRINPSGKWALSGGTSLESTVTADTQTHILLAILDGTNSRLWVDGVLTATGDAGSPNINGFYLGKNGANGSEFFDGRIGEAGATQEVLNAADRAILTNYLGAKWGVTVQGPVIPEAGLRGWYDADDPTAFSYSSGTAVSQWRDRSGAGKHLSQASAPYQPSRSGTMNLRPTVVFTYMDTFDHRHLAAAVVDDWAFLHNADHSIFVVLNVTGSNENVGVMGTTPSVSLGPGFDLLGNKTDKTFRHGVTGSGSDVNVVFNISGNGVYANGAPFMIDVIGKPANATPSNRSALRFNGGTAVTANAQSGTPNPGVPPRPFTLGSRANADTGTWLEGQIAEVILYDRALSDAERLQVENYLNQKWLVVAPVTHQVSGTVAVTTTAFGAPRSSGECGYTRDWPANWNECLPIPQLSGTVPVNTTTSGTVTKRSPTSGTAPVVTGTTGTVRAILRTAGIAPVTVGVSGTVTSRQQISGTAAVSVGVTGNVTVVGGAQQYQVSGTVPVVTTVAGDATRVPVVHQVSGTVAVTTAASGNATRVPLVHQVSGAVAVVTNAIGAATRVPLTLSVSGTVPVVTAASGSATIIGGAQTYPVSGTVAVATTVAGGIASQGMAVAGTVPVVTTVAGSVSQSLVVSGTVPVVTSAAGTISRRQPVAGTVPVVTSAAGTVSARFPVSGIVPVTIDLIGSPSSTQGVSGRVDVVTNAIGNPLPPGGTSGTAVVTVGVTGSVTSRQGVSGTPVAVTTGVSGSVTSKQSIAGTAPVTVGVSGSVEINPRGRVDVVTGVSGTVSQVHQVSGSVAVSTGASGSVSAQLPVSGTVPVLTNATGAIGLSAVTHQVSGTVAVSTAVTGDVTRVAIVHQVSGTVAVATTAAGTISAQRAVAGTVAVTTGVAGTFSLRAQVGGTVVVLTTVFGAPRAILLASGTVVVTTAAYANPVVIGQPGAGGFPKPPLELYPGGPVLDLTGTSHYRSLDLTPAAVELTLEGS